MAEMLVVRRHLSSQRASVPTSMHQNEQPKASSHKQTTGYVSPTFRFKNFWHRAAISICRPCSTKQSGKFRPNFFTKLPNELWLNILDLLPLSSAASLVYTCQHMHINFSEKFYSRLRLPQNKSQKIEFLSYLDPDLPSLRLCFPCAIFHTRKSLRDEREDIIYNRDWLWSNCCRPLGILCASGCYVLGWPSMQLIMRAYHHSPEHGIPLDFLEQEWESNDVWNHHAKPSIVNGRLLIRIESTGLMSMDSDFHDINWLWSECHRFLNNRWQLLTCALRHIQSDFSELSSCDLCGKLWRCPGCYTEYTVGIRRFDTAKTILAQEGGLRKEARCSLIFTEWKDLGEGRSPMSDEWRCLESSLDPSAGVLDVIEPSNIRTRFERSIGNDVEDLLVSVLKCY